MKKQIIVKVNYAWGNTDIFECETMEEAVAKKENICRVYKGKLNMVAIKYR